MRPLSKDHFLGSNNADTINVDIKSHNGLHGSMIPTNQLDGFNIV